MVGNRSGPIKRSLLYIYAYIIDRKRMNQVDKYTRKLSIIGCYIRNSSNLGCCGNRFCSSFLRPSEFSKPSFLRPFEEKKPSSSGKILIFHFPFLLFLAPILPPPGGREEEQYLLLGWSLSIQQPRLLVINPL